MWSYESPQSWEEDWVLSWDAPPMPMVSTLTVVREKTPVPVGNLPVMRREGSNKCRPRDGAFRMPVPNFFTAVMSTHLVVCAGCLLESLSGGGGLAYVDW